MGGRDKHSTKYVRISYLHSPPKNPLSGKSSASEFLNLPHAREARGNAHSPYAALRAAKSSDGETDLSLIVVSLLKHARTYFAQHPTQ